MPGAISIEIANIRINHDDAARVLAVRFCHCAELVSDRDLWTGSLPNRYRWKEGSLSPERNQIQRLGECASQEEAR